MTSSAVIVAPHIQFFSGKQDSYTQVGSEWRRLTAEDAARLHTGVNRETREASVGVYVERRPNDLVRVGFDLWRIGSNLRPPVVERLERRWRQREEVNLSKSMLRSVCRRAHISRSFARFEISLHRLEEWKSELSAVLSNPESYEQL
jgi:hypothetical protein